MQSSWTRWIKRIALGFLFLLLVAIAVGATYERLARQRVAKEFPPPGKMIDIGGRRIHLDCRGTGTPIVVLESGADTSDSTLWFPEQDAVAKFTRVCAYDRAGLMWSDPAPGPRDGIAIVSDLHKALQGAHELGPYVMVGASLGGPLVMLFTKDYGSEVAGLVFVDAAHPDQIKRLEQAMGQKETIPFLFKLVKPLASLAWTGLPRLLLPAVNVPELPARVNQEITAYQPTSLGPSFDEADAMERTFNEAGTYRNLGDRPLAVLSHGKPWSAYSADMQAKAGITQEQFEHHDAEWAVMQNEEASWSHDSTHRTLNDSSHVIQLERPDAVIAAIREVIEKVRAHSERPEGSLSVPITH
jgi:pimeloyl-ACP methyl ester carboxylesterase